VYEEIGRGGGRTVKEIAIALNLNARLVAESLLALEQDGLLLYEDERGGLYPFTEEDK